MIATYGEWIDITSRGTSGDQVHDILASWKVDAQKLLTQNIKFEQDGKHYQERAEAAEEEINALRARFAELERAGDAVVNSINGERGYDYLSMREQQAVDAWRKLRDANDNVSDLETI